MYTLLRNVRLRKQWLVEGPSLLIAMLIAEMFYKFHSFTLECVAFLATWVMVSYFLSLARRIGSRKPDVSG